MTNAAGMPELRLRDVEIGDESFMREMTYHAVYACEIVRPEMTEVIDHPDYARYYQNWAPTNGDAGLIAMEGVRLGAAWYRKYDANSIWTQDDINLPEVSIALRPEARGKKLGEAMLDGLLDVARGKGLPALALQVSQRNRRAIRLYESQGFKVVGAVASEAGQPERWGHVMAVDLTV